MEITCHHCGNVWDYQGKGKFYAQCTQCRYQVRLDTAKGVATIDKATVKALHDAGFTDYDITLLKPIIKSIAHGILGGADKGGNPVGWYPIETICFLCRAMRAMLPLSKERLNEHIKERAALGPDYDCLLDKKKWCGEDAP
jgi:hypothetical protein